MCCRLPSKATAGTTFNLLQAALTVFQQWCQLEAVTAGVTECFAGVLKFVSTGVVTQMTQIPCLVWAL